MAEKKDIKEKTKKIYDVLPKLDDQRCGYRSCGEFARAVAEGKAACYRCVSGGSEVTAKVCEIMGAKVPQEAIAQLSPTSVPYRPRLGRGGGGGRGRAMYRGPGEGRGMGQGRARDRGGGGMGRGFGRGRRGR